MNTLIVLAPILNGARAGLEAALADIGTDPAHNAHIVLAESPSTHFARWVIIEDGGAPRLLFCANYDGGLERYLGELVTAGPGMDAVWGACEGYEGPHRFMDFVRAHYIRARGIYDAFPAMSVRDIQDRIAMRETLEQTLDLRDIEPGLQGEAFLELLGRIRRLPRTGTPLTRLAEFVDGTAVGLGQAVHRPALALFLAAARTYSQIGQARVPPKLHEDPTRDLPQGKESAVQTALVGLGAIQNQMNTVTELVPGRVPRLQIALWGTGVLGAFGWPPGKFADVGTLHWFAWAPFDDNRRLLFMSTFDGSWQNYMADFINKLVWALDALYNNTPDYPAAGMRDVSAFMDFILRHQRLPNAFYSAYPGETVSDLMRDREITTAMATADHGRAMDRWLLQL